MAPACPALPVPLAAWMQPPCCLPACPAPAAPFQLALAHSALLPASPALLARPLRGRGRPPAALAWPAARATFPPPPPQAVQCAPRGLSVAPGRRSARAAPRASTRRCPVKQRRALACPAPPATMPPRKALWAAQCAALANTARRPGLPTVRAALRARWGSCRAQRAARPASCALRACMAAQRGRGRGAARPARQAATRQPPAPPAVRCAQRARQAPQLALQVRRAACPAR